MLASSWLKASARRFSCTSRRPKGRSRESFVLRLHTLEDRSLPSTFTVTTLADGGTGSLRTELAAADAATSASTIRFATGLHGTINLTSGELYISNNVTVDGPGANILSVSGGNSSRVFEVAGGCNVTVSGLTIEKGFAAEEGGGILNDGSNLNLSGVVLAQNVATGTAAADRNGGALGGGLFSQSGTLTITDCQFVYNQAVGGSSAVGVGCGGGIEIEAGTATISNSTLSENLAEGANGTRVGYGQSGAIDLASGTLNLTNDTLSDNEAVGGNDVSGSGGYALGGAVASAGGLFVSGCSFTGNAARGGTGGIGDFVCEGEGGALCTFGTATIKNTAFDNNTARSGNGGTGTYAGEGLGGAVYGGGTATFTNCAVTGNRAVGGSQETGEFSGEGSGGGVYCFGNFTFAGTSFENNQSVGGNGVNGGVNAVGPFVGYAFGGALDNTSGTIQVTGGSFIQNEALGGNDSVAIGTDIIGVGGAEGGAVYNEVGATLSLSGTALADNQAIGGSGNSGTAPAVLVGEGLGGAVVTGYGGSQYGPNTLTVTNCTISLNVARGGCNNLGSATTSELVGTGAGGGIANYAGGITTIASSLLTGNEALGGAGNTASAGGNSFANAGLGGAVLNYLGNFDSTLYGQLSVSTVIVSNSKFVLNLAEGAGDGLGGGIASVMGVSTSVGTSSVSLNEALGIGSGAGLGGGLYDEATSVLSLSHSDVTLNQAIGNPGSGGGVYYLGAFNEDAASVIALNFASTSGNNVST